MYAFALCLRLRFESLHVRTDQKGNASTNTWLTQTHTWRHYTTTVWNLFYALGAHVYHVTYHVTNLRHPSGVLPLRQLCNELL